MLVAAMTYTNSKDSGFTPNVKLVASPAKVLQNIVVRQLSGRLTVGDPNDASIFWRVYAGNGKIHFATSAMGQRERLAYLLQWYYPELELITHQAFESDYQTICHYWQSGQLSLLQVRKLLFWLTQEAFVQMLALPHAAIKFEKTVNLNPLLLSVPLKPTIMPMRGFIHQWVKMRPEIHSPFQRPTVKNPEQFSKMLLPKIRNVQFIKSLLKVLSKNVSIYEAAYYLKAEALGVSALLKPAIRAGIVELNPYEQPALSYRPLIACIDDSLTMQRNVKLILEASGYQVLELREPTHALSNLARYKPDLILMDINMPNMNGYELCRLLRQSALLKEIPIVMLTGRDSIIDKLRARVEGASDYLSKPFQPQQLVSIVQNNLYAASLKVKKNCVGA